MFEVSDGPFVVLVDALGLSGFGLCEEQGGGEMGLLVGLGGKVGGEGGVEVAQGGELSEEGGFLVGEDLIFEFGELEFFGEGLEGGLEGEAEGGFGVVFLLEEFEGLEVGGVQDDLGLFVHVGKIIIMLEQGEWL